jgi:hypothetical protein
MPKRSSRSKSLVTPRRPSESWGVEMQEQEEGGGNGEEEREELASGNAMQGHQRHVADECEQRE